MCHDSPFQWEVPCEIGRRLRIETNISGDDQQEINRINFIIMTWTLIVVLILVGFLFLLLEVLVLPGTNVAGVIGFLLIAAGVWQSFSRYGDGAGTITLVASLVFSVVFLVFALKSKTWSRALLNTEIDGRVNLIDGADIQPGDKGKTVSRLNPSGKALIKGSYYEVKTLGTYMEPDTDIEIIKIEANKITVKPLNV